MLVPITKTIARLDPGLSVQPADPEISQTVLDIVLIAERTKMPTENLLHVAAVLNISVPGALNIHFKLRASIRKILNGISSSDADCSSSTSVADSFKSFEVIADLSSFL